MDIEDCIKEGFLQRIPPDRNLVKKEIDEAEYDMGSAAAAFKDKDYKWCIVKCYYSMFHSARAVLFSIGLRERRHFAIGIVLEDMNKKGMLESRFLADFSSAMSAREDAGYNYKYSQETASLLLSSAKDFLRRFRIMVKK